MIINDLFKDKCQILYPLNYGKMREEAVAESSPPSPSNQQLFTFFAFPVWL
jgi:hypothetical protein